MEVLDQEQIALINLINHQPDIDKKFLYVKDPYEEKYQLLLNKHKRVHLKHCNDPKVLLSTLMIWMIFIKILINIIQIKKRKNIDRI